MGAPSSLMAYQARGLAEAPNVGSASGPLSLRERRALLYAIPAAAAALVSATTVALPCATACLGMPRFPVATYATASFTTSAEVRATVGTITPTPRDLRYDLLCVGALRGEKPQRRSHEGSAAELYRLAARDRAALQTHRQVVERSFLPRRRTKSPLHLPSSRRIPPSAFPEQPNRIRASIVALPWQRQRGPLCKGATGLLP